MGRCAEEVSDTCNLYQHHTSVNKHPLKQILPFVFCQKSNVSSKNMLQR